MLMKSTSVSPLSQGKLVGQKPPDFHDILRLFDGASLPGYLSDLMSWNTRVSSTWQWNNEKLPSSFDSPCDRVHTRACSSLHVRLDMSLIGLRGAHQGNTLGFCKSWPLIHWNKWDDVGSRGGMEHTSMWLLVSFLGCPMGSALAGVQTAPQIWCSLIMRQTICILVLVYYMTRHRSNRS